MPLQYNPPPSDLAIELEEVRADASALEEFFKQLNAPLPDNFPKTSVLDLASALRELPEGTARGCLRPLAEAQSQLAAIRSQHILHEDKSHPQSDESSPAPLRGEPIDQRLRDLISSVSTALQTANRLSGEEWGVEAPEAGVSPTTDGAAESLVRQSIEVNKELGQERKELDSIKNKASQQADILRRKITDTLVLSLLGRVELRMPRIVVTRLRRLANTLREYPTLLEQSAELIVQGADVADYAYDKWHSLKEKIFKVGTQTIREIAEDLRSYSQRLDQKRRAAVVVQQLPETPEPPEDFNIYAATAMIHEGKSPPEAWRPFIDYLPLGNRRLGSLEPLRGLSKLRHLTKVKVRVSDISALAEVKSLESLNLDGTAVRNLNPLADLTSIQSISIDGTPVTDISPLANLSNLRYLSLTDTNISNLEPISNLTSITSLHLGQTNVSDLAPLSKLSSLQFLSLANTRVKDITALSKLNALQTLYLDNTKVDDIEPLGQLNSLRTLHIGNTNVSDLTPLSESKSIKSLHLNDTKIKDLSPLSQLDLTYLGIAGTQVTDLSPVSNMKELGHLDIQRTGVKSLDPLINLPSLRWLFLKGLSDIEIPPSLSSRVMIIKR
jgi:Leucine-rich repeat (LRR) protein